MPRKCNPKDLKVGEVCWEVRSVGATLYQGANCEDKKRKLVPLKPADARIRAAIKEALEKHR